MKFALGLLLLGACTISTGCAQGQLQRLAADSVLCSDLSLDAGSDVDASAAALPGQKRKARGTALSLAEYRDDDVAAGDQLPPEPSDDGAIVEDLLRRAEVVPEVIDAPAPSFRPGAGEIDIDRFTRRVTEVPLDIRNTAGAMPEDVSAPPPEAFPRVTLRLAVFDMRG